MNNDLLNNALILHTILRPMLFSNSFDKVYKKISLSSFTLYERHFNKGPTININHIKELALHLYKLDNRGTICTSCVSIALTIQTMLFCMGKNSVMRIGIKKQDEKLFSHAWLELDNQKIDSDPSLKKLDILQSRTMLEEVNKAILEKDICILG